MKRLFMAALLVCFAAPAFAQDRPLLDAKRLSAAFGTNYVWYSQAGNQLERDPVKEFEAGIYTSYNLLASEPKMSMTGVMYSDPLLSLAGSVLYSLDSKEVRTSLGLRLILIPGGH